MKTSHDDCSSAFKAETQCKLIIVLLPLLTARAEVFLPGHCLGTPWCGAVTAVDIEHDLMYILKQLQCLRTTCSWGFRAWRCRTRPV